MNKITNKFLINDNVTTEPCAREKSALQVASKLFFLHVTPHCLRCLLIFLTFFVAHEDKRTHTHNRVNCNVIKRPWSATTSTLIIIIVIFIMSCCIIWVIWIFVWARGREFPCELLMALYIFAQTIELVRWCKGRQLDTVNIWMVRRVFRIWRVTHWMIDYRGEHYIHQHLRIAHISSEKSKVSFNYFLLSMHTSFECASNASEPEIESMVVIVSQMRQS